MRNPQSEKRTATEKNGYHEPVSLAEAAIFEYAFRLGAQLMMGVQSDIGKIPQKLRNFYGILA